MNTQELITRIIPPSTHEFREGFSNHEIIDGLNDQEKNEVERELIVLLELSEDDPDTLIVETLAYMKSKKSLVTLRRLIKKHLPIYIILSIATSIYDIDKDERMIDIAIQNFEKLKSNTDIMVALYYLYKLNHKSTDDIIRKYLDHKDYYVSYHAKRFMDLRANPNLD
jgi:hypothetical protein